MVEMTTVVAVALMSGLIGLALGAWIAAGVEERR